jgi:prepilin-type N-terminal cleavage/methylation domain-containing protein
LNNQKTKSKNGFTIIEVLVVVVIIGLLVTGGVIKWQQSTRVKRAQIRAQQIKDMIEQARNYALTGENVPPGSVVPESFVFSITGGNTYKIGSVNPNNNVINLKTVTIPATDGILLENATIYFSPPHAEMTRSVAPCAIRVCGDNACADPNTIFTINVTTTSIDVQ